MSDMGQEQTFFHVDVNSAFLSWEAAYRTHILGDTTDLRTVPAVIGGDQKKRHGIVLAKSNPAKKYKIHTGEALYAASQKCPQLIIIPPDYNRYLLASKALIELLKEFSPKVEQYSIDEAFVDMSGSERLYGSSVLVANHIKDRIENELKFTVNIGIGPNRLLAKMAGELKKPNMVHTLYPEQIAEKMWPLPVEDMFFVGRATAKKVRKLGIKTIGELAHTDLSILKQHLGKIGETIYLFANGIEAPYFIRPIENKGYGNSVTMPYDIVTMDYAQLVLLSLCETVCTRLRTDHVKASCISVSYRTCMFEQTSHQGMLYSASNTTSEVYEMVKKLLSEIWKEDIPLRQLGVHTSKITKETERQIHLLDQDRYEKFEKVDHAVDLIRDKYGENAVMRACFLNSGMKHMQGGTPK